MGVDRVSIRNVTLRFDATFSNILKRCKVCTCGYTYFTPFHFVSDWFPKDGATFQITLTSSAEHSNRFRVN